VNRYVYEVTKPYAALENIG